MLRSFIPTLLTVSIAAMGLAAPATAGDYGKKDKAEKAQSMDIVDIAAGNEDFSTLVAAVKAAGLVDALKGNGPFTVFAPTNDAFAALPAGTVENLLKPENKDQLVAILTYHVVPGRVPAAAVLEKAPFAAKSLEGTTIPVRVVDGKVMVDNATVVKADIKASNGIIHVIDAVILPTDNEAQGASR